MTEIPIKRVTNDIVKLSNPTKRINVLFRIVVSLDNVAGFSNWR